MTRNCSGILLPVSMLLVVLVLAVPSNASAGGRKFTEDSSSRGVITGVRLWFWMMSGWGGPRFGVGNQDYFLAVLGGSFGVELEDLCLVEGGGSFLFGTDGPAFELFLRGGIELDILSGRGGHKAYWRLSWLALLGYRYMRLSPDHNDDISYEGYHCVVANTGFELMKHSKDGSGVGFRLLFGGSLPFALDDTGWTEGYTTFDSKTVILDAYLALVLAF